MKKAVSNFAVCISIVLFFSILRSCPPLYASGLRPTLRDEGNFITLENDYSKFVLNKNGQSQALIDKESGRDYLDHSAPIDFMTVRKGNVEFGSSRLERNGEIIDVDFEGSGVHAQIRMRAYPGYYTVEVLSINQNVLDALVIADLPTIISERVARNQLISEHSMTINVARDDHFGISLESLNLMTDSDVLKYEPAAFKAVCYPRYGMVGAKAAILTGPADKLLELIGDMEVEQGLPHPTFNGVWGKISDEVKKSYLFVDYTEQNVDHVIDIAKTGGFSYILNYGDIWAASNGKFEVNKKFFPHGLDGVKAVMDRIHAAGLKCGAHIMSGCISRNDAYVTPVPDPRLVKDDMRVLAADIAAGATNIPVTDTPAGLPLADLYGASSGTAMVIDREIIRYRGLKTEPPFELLNCERGVYGTKAEAHSKGARIYHLYQRWGLYAADVNTDMAEEVAQRVADIINYCGFDQLYFDGLDGVEANGPFFFNVGKMVHETCRRFNRSVIVQGSNLPHFGWHEFSRLYTIDWSSLDPKGRTAYHCRERMQNARNNLMPAELGWFGFFTESNDTEATTPDIIEFVLAKTIAWDVPWSLETSLYALDHHGRTKEILDMCKTYEKLRLDHYFSENVKKRLRELKQDFTLRKDDAGNWQMHPLDLGPAFLSTKQNGTNNAWTINNRYREQPVKVRIKARPSTDDYGDPENIVLAGCDDVSGWKAESNRADFTLRIEQSTEQVKVGSASLKLSASNSTDQPSTWASRILQFNPPVDLSSHRRPGLWIYGDGSGALVVLQFSDNQECSRDFFIRLDFSGWNYSELLEPAHMLEVADVPLPGYAIMSERNFNYNRVISLALLVTDVPPNRSVAYYLSPIEALREHPTTLENPSIKVDNQSIAFPVTLENNWYLEYWGAGDATVYDQEGHTRSTAQVEGAVPSVSAGVNKLEFLCNSSPGQRRHARIQVFTQGDAIPNR
ncbi:MAG: hypothetical protein M1608_08220 [Candidatus Omnitrophica bacterium]|nr:hypothetical protein [Candidatus Omnitrophota bacterium]